MDSSHLKREMKKTITNGGSLFLYVKAKAAYRKHQLSL